MSHLIAISVGPVQEFIAAARRTRDLWFGSHVLSEISRAVAKAIESKGGKLIFPASSDAENVANIILAELASRDPKEIDAKAKEAAQARWREFAKRARGEAPSVIREDLWNDQVEDVIEFYAAWVPHTDPKNYQQDRARVMRLLAGRKSCRDFQQPGFSDAGLPKSSLDGQRPTVLAGPKPGESRQTYRDKWPKNLRLSPGEQLDVVGVTKRLGKKREGNDPRYPSVARIAAETWLRGVKDEAAFQKLRNACAAVPGLNKVAEPNYDYFPYEGTIIYKDRHSDLIKELGEEVKDPLKQVAKALEHLGGEPNPYLAVLVADGDKIGATLSTLTSTDAHSAFSKALAGFAEEARKIVNDQCGVLIYAGGDDVLAFLPVDKCLDCARELRNKFVEILKEHKNEEGETPTLSVGIAIGHFMENLEDLLEYGRAAEKAAKKFNGKDALAVHLHKRGGAPIGIVAPWNDGPETRLTRFANLMNQGIIPTKLPYELRSMANLYERWTDHADTAIQQDLYRLIAKKASRGVATVRQALSEDLQAMKSDELLTLGQELLVARQVAAALRQAGERPAPVMEAAP